MQPSSKTLIISVILLQALGLVVQFGVGPGPAVQPVGAEANINGGVAAEPAEEGDLPVAEPDLAPEVDQQELNGKRWGPSYTGPETIEVPGPPSSSRPATVWGPAYAADDTQVAPDRDRPTLELMKQIDQNALRACGRGHSIGRWNLNKSKWAILYNSG